MTASQTERGTRRNVSVITLILTGTGVGTAPSVDHANTVESTTRVGPGHLRFTLKESFTKLVGFGQGASNDDYDTTEGRKKASLGDVDVKTARTIDVWIEDGDKSRQVDEWTNAPAPSTNALRTAAASAASTQTVLAAALTDSGGKAELLLRPRNVTFTVAGANAAHAPTSALITGTDINGDTLSETVSITASAGTYQGAKAFRTITSIALSGGTGTGATVAIGFGKKFGFSKKIAVRAGAMMFGKEIAAGSVVTNGTLANPTTSPPNGSYSPNTDPDGSNDYAQEYEPANNNRDMGTHEKLYLIFRLSKEVTL